MPKSIGWRTWKISRAKVTKDQTICGEVDETGKEGGESHVETNSGVMSLAEGRVWC
jgi:hypothetical protein